MTHLSKLLKRRAVVIFEGDLWAVRYYARNGDLWVWAGRGVDKFEVMRQVGREAADLQSSFTWSDAAIVTMRVREDWPEMYEEYKPSSVCECHACRERRDRDAEAAAQLPRPEPSSPKPTTLSKLFFEWLLWGK